MTSSSRPSLRQDRHTGIMGELGAEAPVIPVHVKIRAHGDKDAVIEERDLRFNVFVQQKWTPLLMSTTLSVGLVGVSRYTRSQPRAISVSSCSWSVVSQSFTSTLYLGRKSRKILLVPP